MATYSAVIAIPVQRRCVSCDGTKDHRPRADLTTHGLWAPAVMTVGRLVGITRSPTVESAAVQGIST